MPYKKEERKRKAHEWYLRNKKRVNEQRRKWYLLNKEHKKEYDRIYLEKNKDKIRLKRKEFRILNQDKIKAYRQKPEAKRRARERMRLRRKNNGEYVREQCRQYSRKNRVRINERSRLWKKNNPRSGKRGGYDLQDSMNNVRIRDKNTCQWQGCGLTFRQAPIHVHHIYPKSEYPDLQLIEQYMICYCMNHHWMWHKYRGDDYARLLQPKQITLASVRGRD